MFTEIPEVNYTILKQMNDQQLSQVCQTNHHAKELCEYNDIQARLDLYKAYLHFDLFDHMEEIEFKYPLMIFRMEEQDGPYINALEIYVLKADTSTIIKYFGDVKKAGDQDGTVSIDILNNLQPYDVLDILSDAQGVDLNTVRSILQQRGFKKYEKDYLQYYIQTYYESLKPEPGLKGFYKVLALHLWFKSHCMFLKLVNEYINEIDQDINLEFVNSEEGIEEKYKRIQEIDFYYDILTDYIEDLH